jgi:hypothetical protein
MPVGCIDQELIRLFRELEQEDKEKERKTVRLFAKSGKEFYIACGEDAVTIAGSFPRLSLRLLLENMFFMSCLMLDAYFKTRDAIK